MHGQKNIKLKHQNIDVVYLIIQLRHCQVLLSKSNLCWLCIIVTISWLLEGRNKECVPVWASSQNLRRTTVNSVISSLSTWNETRLPLDGFSWNLILENVFENRSRKFKFHYRATRITGTLHENPCTFMVISRWIIFRIIKVSGKSCSENQNTFHGK